MKFEVGDIIRYKKEPHKYGKFKIIKKNYNYYTLFCVDTGYENLMRLGDKIEIYMHTIDEQYELHKTINYNDYWAKLNE